MNGKKAKLMRKTGNSSKAGKRLYQELPHNARAVASDILRLRSENPVEGPAKTFGKPHQTGLNRKFRRLADKEQRRLNAIRRAKERNTKKPLEVEVEIFDGVQEDETV